MKRIKSLLALVLSVSMLLGSGEIPALAENYRDDVSGNMWEDVSTNDVSSSEIMENEEAEEILTDISACEDEKETEVLESIPEDVSSNDEYEIAVSDNDISFEEATFAGMPEGYELSEKQKQYALELEDCLADIYGLEEGIDYAPGEVMLCTETEEEAELVARAYNGTLESYEYGVAVITLSGNNTVVHAVNACVKSATAPASSTLPVLPAVYPNYYMKTCSAVEDTTEETTEETELPEVETYDEDKLPTLDPSSGMQEYHEMIGDYHVWGKGYTGGSRFAQRVRVAVADTGIYKGHSELSTNSRGDGWSSGEAAGDPWTDTDGHGTHLAGIIGAASNGAGVVGVAPETSLMSLKIANAQGQIDVASATAALNYVVYNAQYNNSSYFYKTCNIFLFGSGCYGYNSYLQEACTNAYKAGIIIFAPMGNDGCSARFYPACYKNVYGVAALTEAGTIASFSNYNKNASFAFPGVDIWSTNQGGTDKYTTMSGTSQAAAIAAGVAADVLSCLLKSGKTLEGKDRVDAVIKAMKKGAKKSPDSGTGAGYVYLPTALGVITHASAPSAPIIETWDDAPNATRGVNLVEVQLKSEEIFNTDIYYSTNGKAPVYKNGKCTNGTKYTGIFSISGAKKITLQAIAVNPVTGLSSKVAKRTYKIDTVPNKVTVTASGVTKTIKVLKGKSVTLKAKVEPSYAYSTKVKWRIVPEESMNSGLGITLKNGKVTVSKNAYPGKYVIEAGAVDYTTVSQKLKEKDYKYNGKYDTFTIEVVEESNIESVSFAKEYKKFSLSKGTTMSMFPLVSVKLKGVEKAKQGTTQYVAYVSSNPNIVSINNDGYSISTNGPGNATITAYATDGSGKKATCTITVTVPVSSIDVRDDLGYVEGYAARGKSIQLKCKTNSDATVKKVKWEAEGAEGKAALTVSSSGKVTVKKSATVGKWYIVRATITDTTSGDKKWTDTYRICPQDGAVTSFSLYKKSFNLFTQIESKKTLDLWEDVVKSYKISSGNKSEFHGVYMTSSNPEIVSVESDGRIITALAPGKTKITITARDSGRKKASFTVNVLTPASDIVVEAGGGFARDVVYGSSSFEDIPVAEGGSIKLTVRLEAKYGKISSTKVKWSVVDEDDRQYVKIDSSGKVTIKKVKPYEITDEGAVRVRATMTDGSELYCNYKIFTTEKTAKVTLTEVSKNKYRVKAYDKKGNEKSLINCRIEVPEGVEITSRTNNTFKFDVEKDGKYTVKVTVLDGSGKSLKKKIELKK